MSMKNPCHPGEIIREEVLEPLGLTVTEAAKALAVKVARPTLSNLLNGTNASLTADMAFALRRCLAPAWIISCAVQLAYDLAQARKREASLKKS